MTTPPPAELKPPKKIASPPPFETDALRKGLHAFTNLKYLYETSERNIGWFKWGVYIFYDYDREPIYVGQTNEKVSGRISRHLTNQRTDAVAMNVLDPFEVFEIEVYPLPEYQKVNSKHPDFKEAREKLTGTSRQERQNTQFHRRAGRPQAGVELKSTKKHLDALEYYVHQKAIAESKFKAILNEKDPDPPKLSITLPNSVRGAIVSHEVLKLRSHPDVRIARRSQTIAKLAQVISERDIQKNGGLRRVLLVQSQRLESLAKERYHSLGGEVLVEHGSESAEEESEDE